MDGFASVIKQVELSEGFFCCRVVKGYPVGTLVWTDKTALQKYVKIQVEVPLCTKAFNLDTMPMLVDSKKQAWVWIGKKPMQLSMILWSSWAFAWISTPLKPKEKTSTPRSPGTHNRQLTDPTPRLLIKQKML